MAGTNTIDSNLGQGTKKLYYEDAYLSEFDATVLSCEEVGQGRYAVVLDQTAFFPEEGGQSADRGSLFTSEMASVLDVQIRKGVITHTTDKAFTAGQKVHGVLDFAHRFSNMQQHSAEHLFSGIIHSRTGAENVGFHLSDREVTMDYSLPISEKLIAEAEMAVNEAIWKNFESKVLFPDEDELRTLAYRSKKEIAGQVRVVIFPGYDACACCAPHVKRTGEIGIFKVLQVQNYKGGVRVHMLAGRRAVEYLQREHQLLDRTAKALSTATENVPEQVEKMRSERAMLSGQVAQLMEEALVKEIEGEIIRRGSVGTADVRIADRAADRTAAWTAEKAAGGTVAGTICLFVEDCPAQAMRNAVNRILKAVEQAGNGSFGEKSSEIVGSVAPIKKSLQDVGAASVLAVFTGNDQDGYRYVLGSHDAAILLATQKALAAQGAKGGGKPPMLQGQIRGRRSLIEKILGGCSIV